MSIRNHAADMRPQHAQKYDVTKRKKDVGEEVGYRDKLIHLTSANKCHSYHAAGVAGATLWSEGRKEWGEQSLIEIPENQRKDF